MRKGVGFVRLPWAASEPASSWRRHAFELALTNHHCRVGGVTTGAFPPCSAAFPTLSALPAERGWGRSRAAKASVSAPDRSSMPLRVLRPFARSYPAPRPVERAADLATAAMANDLVMTGDWDDDVAATPNGNSGGLSPYLPLPVSMPTLLNSNLVGPGPECQCSERFVACLRAELLQRQLQQY